MSSAALGATALAGTWGWLALFGLTDRLSLGSAALAVAYFATAFRLARRFAFYDKPRPRAWVLTLACATPLGPFGALRAASLAAAGTLADQSVHFTTDPLSHAATVMFVAFLVSDTVYGLAHYPSQFELVAGWVHHAVYLVFFALCLRWRMSAAVALAYPLELTTIVLALGHIHPPLRSDWLFGGLFLALRLGYHGAMLRIYVAMRAPPVTLWPFMAAVMVLHVHWFAGWARGMWRRHAPAGEGAHAQRATAKRS